MKRRTFLKLGTGAVVGGALSACGGAHDGGALAEPDPQPAPATGKDADDAAGQRNSANAGMMGATPPLAEAPCRLNNLASTRSTIRGSG
jgi:hypothetical protein